MIRRLRIGCNLFVVLTPAYQGGDLYLGIRAQYHSRRTCPPKVDVIMTIESIVEYSARTQVASFFHVSMEKV